ncbi:tRNA (adenosine(37)-N6)-dimethylallyltransferase MiaA [Pseudanabaena biceps]|nr:tRNA (adenosine(37)-N6)-dimethylallyltransferase MiaA [Pseudanabaena biceps]
MTSPLITLLAGPTASGKSALALAWAQRTGGLILNADSQQLYADLRVLTARPSPADEAAAEHALYGVADAAEAWSVGRWSRAALPLIDTAVAAGRPVLLVGGTGLYFHALTRGLAEVPEPGPEARAAAAQLFDTEGESAVRARLQAVDPTAAAAIGPRDRQRLVRALAVAEGTGRALSAWQADTRPLLAPGSWRGRVLEPERATLYAACDARAAAMIEGGALDEVEALLARGLSPELPALKAVGVRELAGVLRGETSLQEARAQLQQATRNYAKRQLTWFRNQTADWPRIGPAGLEG